MTNQDILNFNLQQKKIIELQNMEVQNIQIEKGKKGQNLELESY